MYESSSRTLLVTATDAQEFGAPYAENWLGEPLRILFGQLIYPRLVARNVGSGRAQVSIRRSPPLIPGSAWAALWSASESRDREVFWRSYGQLLTMIACDRDSNGQPNFEANKLTRLYEECILAARGSRWVWALTFASSIEAVARMLRRKGASSDQGSGDPLAGEIDAVERLTNHIQAWCGQDRLKDIAISAARRSIEMTPVRILRHLREIGVISGVQFNAWDKIRNAVMHGSLISPFSTEEEDKQLLALGETLHALTWELLRRTPFKPEL